MGCLMANLSMIRASHLLILVGGLISVAVGPVLLGADTPADDILAQRRSEIEAMTETERNRLKHNYERYLKLNDEERKRCHKLHNAVENDASLRDTLTAYHEWLKTLSPWKRDELRKTTDPQARLELIRKIKDEQNARDRQRRDWFRRSNYGRGPGFGHYMNREEFATFMQNVEAILRSNSDDPPLFDHSKIDQDKLKELESLDGSARYVQLMEILLNASEMPPIPRRGRWVSDRMTERMIAAIPNDDVRQQFEKSDTPVSRRLWLVAHLVGGLMMETQAEWKVQQPTQEELAKFFKELDTDDREKIQRLPGEEGNDLLKIKYFFRAFEPMQHARKLFDQLPSHTRPSSGGDGRRFPNLSPGRRDDNNKERPHPLRNRLNRSEDRTRDR